MHLRSTIVLVAALSAPALAQIERQLPRGVSPEVQASIQRGLEYLRGAQQRHGGWVEVEGYPVAMTSLVGMAFLASGSTPTRGRDWRMVRDAARFLVKASGESGLIATPHDARPMFGHGFATMFLAQIYGMEDDERRQREVARVLRRAVALTARSQSHQGGWMYQPDSNRDEGSGTVVQIQGLRACRNAGITVPIGVIDKALQYIRNSANEDGSIRYGVDHSGAGRAPLSAAAVAVLFNAGLYDDPLAVKALTYARRHLPINGSGNYHHYYSQMYLSQALYNVGGEDWDDYYAAMSRWLVEQQGKDGSWQGDRVGRVYGTAVALVILQLPHAMVPIYQR